jgi:hypothetical protein
VKEVDDMRKYVVLIVMFVAMVAAVNLEARELVISPSRVETIVSPTEERDARVLVFFELPPELLTGKLTVDNAILVFDAQVAGADFGLLHIFPVTKAWTTEQAVAWSSPWDKAGGDYTQGIAGRSITMKAAEGEKRVSSNVTFIVMEWLSGKLVNNGLILVPSEQDLLNSSVRYRLQKGSVKLKIECTESRVH